METKVVPYKRFSVGGALNRFHVASNLTHVITFPDALHGVTHLDFTKMMGLNGELVKAKNSTHRTGKFLVEAFNEDGALSSTKTIVLRGKSTSYGIENLGSIGVMGLTLGNLKSIRLRAKTINVYLTLAEESEFRLTMPITNITSKIFSSRVRMGWKLNGSRVRIVNRVQNAYRRISDPADIVVSPVFKGSSVEATNLVPGKKYLLVLQRLGKEWVDVGQAWITSVPFSITKLVTHSRTLYAKWSADFPGATYTLTYSSDKSTGSIKTGNQYAIVNNLDSGTSYTVSVQSE